MMERASITFIFSDKVKLVVEFLILRIPLSWQKFSANFFFLCLFLPNKTKFLSAFLNLLMLIPICTDILMDMITTDTITHTLIILSVKKMLKQINTIIIQDITILMITTSTIILTIILDMITLIVIKNLKNSEIENLFLKKK